MNPLLSKPIPGLIKQIAIPASVGFFFNTMYNVTDTLFAGLFGTQAIAALSLSFPIFFMIIAMGAGLSQGTNALLANKLGEGKRKAVAKTAAQAMSFGFLFSFFMMIVGLYFSPALFKLLGATDSYLADSLAYMNVILYGTTIIVLTSVSNAILLAHGDSKSFRNALVGGFFLNFLFNPLFMFGFWIIPALGIAGIAVATIVIQCFILVYMLYKVYQLKLFSRMKIRHFKPNVESYTEISIQGFPASLNMMTVAIGMFIITYFLSQFGQEAVAAFGIATRIEQLALLPGIGLNMATLSLVGQNNGAKRYDRVKETYYTCMRYSLILSIFGGIFVFFLVEPLMRVFTKDLAVVTIGIGYLQIASFIFFAYGILFLSTALFQGLKKPFYALVIGITRQIIIPVIVFSVLIFGYEIGLFGVWWGIFAITWTSAIVFFAWARSHMPHI